MNIIIRQKDNGKWQSIISYKVNDEWKQKSKGGFDRKKDAEKWAKEMSFELQKLEKSGVLGNEYTLGEIFELFFEIKTEIRKGTKQNYKSTMLFFEDFLDKIISEIRFIDLQRFLTKRRRETGNVFNIYLRNLSAVYNFAIDIKACTENVASKLTKIETEDTREKFITEDLYAEILKNTKKEKEKLFLRTAYETGARCSELFGITTQNVYDFKIRINQQFKENLLKKDLKTKNSYREVPISKKLFYDLKKADCNIDGRIFYDIQRNTVSYHLKKFNVSPHCFRHTRASLLVSQNFDLSLIANVMGDKIETIMNTYAHINKDKIKDDFEKLQTLCSF